MKEKKKKEKNPLSQKKDARKKIKIEEGEWKDAGGRDWFGIVFGAGTQPA